ncbi:uncharacterized protein BCR38DRAFT_224952 [Pseudomassariella vexata]|uniref:Uncharacterized protein n=1 Tax=Pseudomassariella vexata TaxID=1141098 RepID=A0A1Y2DVS9_9PEZI|nr:uncharacterized protein BCR38DRAFT_224952 [Pseudomassariella vexata]ORY63224.1 hypothetical protein BCR38DRAFT_224952 [Pseudomassariella vexata]
MKKSQQGLLRTLLFDIFRRCPQLIADKYDKQWPGLPNKDDVQYLTWNLPMLCQVLKRLMHQNNIPVTPIFRGGGRGGRCLRSGSNEANTHARAE